MAAPFDPARSVTFDLNRGHVELADGEAHVLVPVAALAAFAAGESGARALGHAIGVGAIGRVAVHIAREGDPRRAIDGIRGASLETVVELLGGELAVVGLGSLRVERWGSALLFVLDPHTLDERCDEMVCGVFEGALASVAGRDVHALVVDREGGGGQLRVLVANERAIDRARRLVNVGAFFTEIISMLHDSVLQPSTSEPS
ncbi:MAG: hypothetical protein HOW73_03735 [Polyangiaceae bacterium]|nr:hypothetical protein [Polyangiaceae bacterium]